MTLDRHALARIDRRLFTEFDGGGGVQMVKVPASDALWSVWRRYCDAVGMTMGEAIAGLIAAELGTGVGENPDPGIPAFADRAVQRVVEVTERLEERKRELGSYPSAAAAGRSCRLEARPQRAVSVRIWFQVQALPRPPRATAEGSQIMVASADCMICWERSAPYCSAG